MRRILTCRKCGHKWSARKQPKKEKRYDIPDLYHYKALV